MPSERPGKCLGNARGQRSNWLETIEMQQEVKSPLQNSISNLQAVFRHAHTRTHTPRCFIGNSVEGVLRVDLHSSHKKIIDSRDVRLQKCVWGAVKFKEF